MRVNQEFKFYENIFPFVDEYVIVKVRKINDCCTYVNLLEYNNKEGVIASNEYTKVDI